LTSGAPSLPLPLLHTLVSQMQFAFFLCPYFVSPQTSKLIYIGDVQIQVINFF
jgi:hypothetical protein